MCLTVVCLNAPRHSTFPSLLEPGEIMDLNHFQTNWMQDFMGMVWQCNAFGHKELWAFSALSGKVIPRFAYSLAACGLNQSWRGSKINCSVATSFQCVPYRCSPPSSLGLVCWVNALQIQPCFMILAPAIVIPCEPTTVRCYMWRIYKFILDPGGTDPSLTGKVETMIFNFFYIQHIILDLLSFAKHQVCFF